MGVAGAQITAKACASGPIESSLPHDKPTMFTYGARMTVDRKIWVESFMGERLPSLPCAKCNRGILQLQDIKKAEPNHSNYRSHDDWDPEWISEKFVMIARCNIQECGDIVCIAGSTTIHQGFDEESNEVCFETQYHVSAMVPAPKIIQLPDETPEAVQKELEKAFELFWSDPGSCANRLRVSVERLLDHCKVKKIDIQKGKKQKVYSLNDRIGMFKKEEDLLHALRIIGNLGSHGTATRGALLDAFDIYHDVLQAVLSTRRVSVAALAKKIKKTKGRY
jgi:Domain of unknown function (DUF4145)